MKLTYILVSVVKCLQDQIDKRSLQKIMIAVALGPIVRPHFLRMPLLFWSYMSFGLTFSKLYADESGEAGRVQDVPSAGACKEYIAYWDSSAEFESTNLQLYQLRFLLISRLFSVTT
jgi:hypothetical protein